MSKSFQIKDYPDYYATDTGNIYSRCSSKYNNPSGRIKKLKPKVLRNGYLQVDLYNGKTKQHKSVHRIIAEIFIPNPENKPQVNHKNGDKTDNRVSNLEWVTLSENLKHRYRVLGQKQRKGIEDHRSKPILQIKDGKIIAEFWGTPEAERKTGIYRSNILNCCKGWRKTAGGYIWKYKETKNG